MRQKQISNSTFELYVQIEAHDGEVKANIGRDLGSPLHARAAQLWQKS